MHQHSCGSLRRFTAALLAAVIFVSTFAASGTSAFAQTGSGAKLLTQKTAAASPNAPLVSPNVVISQVYGGGGNTGAQFRNDFIELFNRGSQSVSLSGYSVAYFSAAGTSGGTATSLNGTLQPGQYYLVQEAAGAGTQAALPTPDATGTLNLSATNGRVDLNGPGGLIDRVGYGTANLSETSPTPALSNSTAATRAAAGCTDTDNNSADFTTPLPAPRNTASALNPCGGGTTPTNPSGVGAANPSAVTAGGQTLLTVAVTPGANPTSTALAVTANLTAIGGASSQQFFDNGMNGDVTANDNTFSYLATVAAATTAGAKSLPATITDGQMRSGGATIAVTVNAPAPTVMPQTLPFAQNWANTALITADNDWSAVPGVIGYRGDDLTTVTGTDPQTILADGANTPVSVIANQTNPDTLLSGGVAEFEIANPTVALNGSGTGDAPHLVLFLNTTGQANVTVSYNLRDLDGSVDNAVQPVALQYRIGSTGAYTNVPAAFVADATIGGEAGQITPVAVALPAACDNQPLVQLRIITANANGNDEWVGVDDILVNTNGTLPIRGSGAASPAQVNAGDSTLLTVTVTPGTNPASTNVTVTGDLSPIGGSAAQQFFDDGTNGDAAAGDSVYSFLAQVPANSSGGNRSIGVIIADGQSRTAGVSIALAVIAPADPLEHLLFGNPTNATADENQPSNYLLSKPQYALSYHRDRGIPNWVSWHLDSTWLGSAPRQNDFRPDETLPAGWYRVKETDYVGSGFDRGHHTPSADRTRSIPDNSATFLMTNMHPQSPGNNQGPWERLESDSRTLVNQGNELYILQGSVGVGGKGSNGGVTNTIAEGKVTVPAYTWKVILVLPVGDNDVSRVTANTRTIAVIMPNNDDIRPDAWQKYLATVDQVEQLTGYDFYSNVPVNIQNQIEARLDAASNTAPQSVAPGTYANLDVTSPNTGLTGDVRVTGNLNLGGSTLNAGNFRVTLAPSATVSRVSGYVNGRVEKQFSAIGQTFEYPVGTQNGYSPVNVSITALNQPNSSLTINAVQAALPQAPSAQRALRRYWALTENGDLTATVAFKYLDIDVPPSVLDETRFRLNRYNGVLTEIAATIDAGMNTATAANLSEFSDWTLLAPANPTAATVTVSGKLVTQKGGIVSKAVVYLTDQAGKTRRVTADFAGGFQFENVRAGESVVINVSHKRYVFAPQILTLSDDLTDLILSAQP